MTLEQAAAVESAVRGILASPDRDTAVSVYRDWLTNPQIASLRGVERERILGLLASAGRVVPLLAAPPW